MMRRYSYHWYIQQFEGAKEIAESFILSIDESLFLQPPKEGQWSIAECYSHLINYGDLYYDNLVKGIDKAADTTDDIHQTFPPRWLMQKVVSFFEPPYKIKIKTVKAMKPDPVSGYQRLELLDEYINLQDRFVAQLEKGKNNRVDLGNNKMRHPTWSFLKMTLSECFALAEAHQRRHQWQAEQTLTALTKNRAV